MKKTVAFVQIITESFLFLALLACLSPDEFILKYQLWGFQMDYQLNNLVGLSPPLTYFFSVFLALLLLLILNMSLTHDDKNGYYVIPQRTIVPYR